MNDKLVPDIYVREVLRYVPPMVLVPKLVALSEMTFEVPYLSDEQLMLIAVGGPGTFTLMQRGGDGKFALRRDS